jgi:hypothetical protein
LLTCQLKAVGSRSGWRGCTPGNGRSLRTARTTIELTVLVAGVALGGSAGVGTLAYALAIGPLVHLLLPRLTLSMAGRGAQPGSDPAPPADTKRGASPCHPSCLA